MPIHQSVFPPLPFVLTHDAVSSLLWICWGLEIVRTYLL